MMMMMIMMMMMMMMSMLVLTTMMMTKTNSEQSVQTWFNASILFKVASHPKCQHFGKKIFYNTKIDLTSIFVFQKEFRKNIVLGEIVFSSLIAFNEMLTSHCDNLSSHHYHATYHPHFDTQFRHSETTQQYFCTVAISYRKKRKRSTLPFCTKEIGKKVTSKLF